MKVSSKSTTLIGIVLAVVFFVGVGWTAPALYAANSPSENFIEVHRFTASDTTTGSEYHMVCFERTVRHEAPGDVIIELQHVEDGEVTEVSRDSFRALFQEGRANVTEEASLPRSLEPGTYFYVLNIEMRVANGRVIRSFTYESTPFQVEEGPATEKVTNPC